MWSTANCGLGAACTIVLAAKQQFIYKQGYQQTLHSSDLFSVDVRRDAGARAYTHALK